MSLKAISLIWGFWHKIFEWWELETPKQENKRKSVLKEINIWCEIPLRALKQALHIECSALLTFLWASSLKGNMETVRTGSRKEERGTSAASNRRPVCCSLVTNRDLPLQKAFQYLCSLQLFFLALKQKQNSLFTHCSSAPVLPTPLYLFVWSPRCVAPAPSKSPYNLQLNLSVYSEASAGEITQLGLILSATEFCGSS